MALSLLWNGRETVGEQEGTIVSKYILSIYAHSFLLTELEYTLVLTDTKTRLPPQQWRIYINAKLESNLVEETFRPVLFWAQGLLKVIWTAAV